jgi:hypothetical protein
MKFVKLLHFPTATIAATNSLVAIGPIRLCFDESDFHRAQTFRVSSLQSQVFSLLNHTALKIGEWKGILREKARHALIRSTSDTMNKSFLFKRPVNTAVSVSK